ncbi:MAG: PIG-L family deacetylase [Verrucomicrobia bacterium]|nr:PIG-L family deacetylase [Verrucomicrobiota bacterium]
MNLHNADASVFVPDGLESGAALTRITHLGIGAHSDDLEFMALHGILACKDSPDAWFGGVTCTSGSGSARVGGFADFTDDEMAVVRRQEQDKAAELGSYGVMIQLAYQSTEVKTSSSTLLRDDLAEILSAARPDVVYTHNPADKHDTHISVLLNLVEAARTLPPSRRPGKVLGCEMWRSLDWMTDADKVLLDVSGHEAFSLALSGVFQSQIEGGKRYDLAVQGRRRANATLLESHAADESNEMWFAMDLTPVVKDEQIDLVDYTNTYLEHFTHDVLGRLRRLMGKED